MFAIARRLGPPEARRRRHRRVAIGSAVLLAVALGLILVGASSDEEFDDEADAVCAGYVARIQNEFRLSFPDRVPNAAAFAEYLSHAFADTMDDLTAELRALDPPSDVAAVLDRYEEILTALRATPEEFATAESPFAVAAAAMDDAGPDGCGTAFFAGLVEAQ